MDYEQVKETIFKKFQKYRKLRVLIINIEGLALQTNLPQVKELITNNLAIALNREDYELAKAIKSQIEELILMEKYPV